MNRETVAILLTSTPNYDQYAFKYFVLSLNKIQSLYEFIFPEMHEYFFPLAHFPLVTLYPVLLA